MWGHDFEREWNPNTLAEAMVENFTKYDWDWMKVNPRASYHVEGWGVKLRFSGLAEVKPVVLDVPIKATGDWGQLQPLNPDQGVLDEQQEVCERICEALGGEAYICQT